MTRLFFCLALVLSLSSAYSQHNHLSEKAWDVRIFQNGKEVTHQLGVYQLQKKPFEIQVKLMNVEGVYVYADFSDSIYKTAHSQPIPGYSDLSKTARAELKANAASELKVDKKSWAYWLYDKNKSSNSFNEIKSPNSATVIGSKTIRQFSVNGKTKTVQQASEPLYLYFVVPGETATAPDLGRIKLKLNFK
jgi:hypothetical protein